MDLLLSCGEAAEHIRLGTKIVHNIDHKTHSIGSKDALKDVLYYYTYDNSVIAKRRRFDSLWRAILTVFDSEPYCEIVCNITIPNVNSVDWESTIMKNFIPNYSFTPVITDIDAADCHIDEDGDFKPSVIKDESINLPNCLEPGGFKEIPLSKYIHMRTTRELIPVFSVDPIMMFFNLRSYISIKNDKYLKRLYNMVLAVWVPYMKRFGLSNGLYFSPCRMRKCDFVRVLTDAYFVKRLSITISFLYFAVIYSDFINFERHDIAITAFYEIFRHLFKEPYDGIGVIKGLLSPITLSAGSIPRNISNVSHHYLYEHNHPIYNVVDINRTRHLQNSKSYNNLANCNNVNCSKSTTAYAIYRELRKKDVEVALSGMLELNLRHLYSFARLILTENYNENGMRLIVFFHNMQVIAGYKTSSPIVDIMATVEKNIIRQKTVNLDNDDFKEFSDNLYAFGRKVIKLQKENDLIYDSKKFKMVLPSLMTGKSAGKGKIKLNIEGCPGTYVASDKRIMLIGQGNTTLNLETASFKTSSDHTNPDVMNYRRIGIRLVPGRPARAIYQQNLEEYIVETYICPYIEFHKHPPKSVINPFGDPDNLGNYNIKSRLDNTDNYVASMVEATGNSGQYVAYVDQDQYDMSERRRNVLDAFFRGMYDGAMEHLSHIKTPFTIDGVDAMFPDIIKFYMENCLSRWFVLSHFDYAVQFEVDWLSSGAKFTFDLNSDVNAILTNLVWKAIRRKYPYIENLDPNIAGDDNYWIMDIPKYFFDTGSNISDLMDVMNKVMTNCGFFPSRNKSGLGAVFAEFAKIVGYCGFAARIGLITPFERENPSGAETIIEALRGVYSKLAFFATRHHVFHDFSGFNMFILSNQYIFTSENRALRTKTDIIMHPIFHIMPSSTHLGLGFNFDLVSNDGMQVIIRIDQSLAKTYYAYASGTRPFFTRAKPDISRSVATINFGSLSKQVDFKNNLETTLTLDASVMEGSRNALNRLISRGITIPHDLAYCNVAEEFKNVLMDSIKLLRGRMKDEVNLNSMLRSCPDSGSVNFDQLYPIYGIVNKTDFMTTSVVNRQDLIRYPCSAEPICRLQRILGNKSNDINKRLFSYSVAISRAISNAKRSGNSVSSKLNEDTILNILLNICDLSDRHAPVGGTTLSVTQSEVIYCAKRTGKRMNKNALSYSQTKAATIQEALTALLGTYPKIQSDAMAISRVLPFIIEGELAISLNYGACLYFDTRSDVLFPDGHLSRMNNKYYFNLTLVMYILSGFMMNGTIVLPTNLEPNVYRFYRSVVTNYGRSLGYLGFDHGV